MINIKPLTRPGLIACFAFVAILLLVMVVRISQMSLSYREFHVDEVWSIWILIGHHSITSY
jgi:hypothetical protein